MTLSDRDDEEGGETGRMVLQPPDLDAMFRSGTLYRLRLADAEDEEAVVETREAGKLNLATGRLVACDPSWAFTLDKRTAAYSVIVPPGSYPITVCIARVDRPADPEIPSPVFSVAAVRLTISDAPVARWELALRPGQDIERLPPGGFYGFGVSRGTGAFLDESALPALSRLSSLGPHGEEPEIDELIPELLAKHVLNLDIDHEARRNVIIFLCGMGAGAYPVWIGRTSSGEPATFVADLELLSRRSSGPITVQ